MSKDDMRIEAVADENQDAEASEIFRRALRRYGWLPNTIRVMVQGSSAAELYLAAGELNSGGSLLANERELLAVTVAAHNHCEYCLTAHSLAARGLGLSGAQVLEARDARSQTPRIAAILQFASSLLHASGAVTNHELDRARVAGLTDKTLIDIVGVVIENCLGNLINNLAQTELDDVLRSAARKLQLTASSATTLSTLADRSSTPLASVGATR